MLKGGTTTGQIAPRGIKISTNVYGKAVKLIYGVNKVLPDLIWYNGWQAAGSPSNGRLWTVIGGATQGKKSGKSGKKGGGAKYYSAALDLLLGHAPIAGALTCWYNNQRLFVKLGSVSGFISGNSFNFTPAAGESLVTVTTTAAATVTAANFVSDGQTTQNNTGVYDNTKGRWLEAADPTVSPGPGQYTVDGSGNYKFNAAEWGHSVNLHYRATGTGGGSGIVAGIVAVVVNETMPTTTFDDYGAPGTVTFAGHWDRPLWNHFFPTPGRIDTATNRARDPYGWTWDGNASSPTITFPDSSLNGLPVTVYYGIPVLLKSDGSFYSSTITPLALLNLEFEAACGAGSEYVNYGAEQDINPWCAGLGSAKFDLGAANAVPNLGVEVIGAFTVWPTGDAHVADVITDIVMSGPAAAAITVPHGANCNAYDNGGPLAATFPPGAGLLLGELNSDGIPEGLEDLHAWCLANGIGISLNQDTQRSAKDLLDELATVANSAPVYSGDTLRFIPRDEVSQAANGGIYTAPTAAGPVCDLTDEDFVQASANEPPVKVTRKRRADCDNAVSLEFTDRNIDYMQNVVTENDPLSIALWGPRKGGELATAQLGVNQPQGSKSLKCISNSATAQKIASILAKRGATGADVFRFTVKAEKFWLEAMDLVTVTATRLAFNKVPVRLTAVKETADRTYECEGERFIYGLNHYFERGAGAASGSLVSGNADPGLVNAPIIFQPTCAMSGGKAQVVFIVSGADPNYGGCIVNVSIDGGASYQALPGICGAAITGVLTATLPLPSPAADPDTTSTLSVDLTESNGNLSAQTQATADAFLDPCLVAIESGSPLVMTDYEIVCPTAATLTAAHKYSMGTYMRRGAEGSTYASHAAGCRFAVIDGTALTVDLDPKWVGKTLLFKFQAVNLVGGNANQLPDCVVYSFTPAAACASRTYSQNPPFVLSQVDASHLAIAAFTDTFADNHQASYQARASVAIPGGSFGSPAVATWLYVTIADPTQVGDATGTPLPVYVDANTARVGVQGFTYVGAILALPAGGAVQSTPGGWPAPQGFQVIP